MAKEIIIYTDGASKGNPGKGGYGIVMTLAGTSYQKEFFQGFRLTTNNRMELLAVIEALLKIKDKNCIVNIYSDSKYVVDAINKGWINNWKKKNYKDVKNPDLWKQLIAMLAEYKVSFFWVRGHNGNPLNEKADKLAVQGAESSELKADLYYEQAIYNQ
ncbi:MAG: ribonuclease HI [Flavobacteriales bacterium]|nr:ribonuclease HI [Flavobacteriales bacterium]